MFLKSPRNVKKIPEETKKEVDRSGPHVHINKRDNIVDHGKYLRKKQNRSKSCDPSNALQCPNIQVEEVTQE